MKLGRFEIAVHNFADLRLDGGAMFGAVPKNLWSKKIAPDEDNCIPLASRSLIITDGARRFLIDVGPGDKWSTKMKEIYGIQLHDWPESIERDSITDVILTHLHFDHAGGISHYDSSKKLELTYPKAQIFLQRKNYQNALKPNVRERASYLEENVTILEDGNLTFLDGTQEIYPGITLHEVNGHTRGQQYVEVQDDDLTILFPTDLIPTSHHIALPYCMGYDICTETALSEKEVFLKKAIKTKALLIFQHDREVVAGTVTQDKNGNYALNERITL